MNPEKLFAYLDDTLSPDERAEIEKRLETDSQLQRELAMAREIHKRARGDAREVIFQDEMATSSRGRKMALRIGAGFIALIALNVAIGLIVIAHKEGSNPNRKLLDNQMREQLTKSLDQAAQRAMTPPPLGVNEMTVPAGPGRKDNVADKIAAIVVRINGSATKGLPNEHDVSVLVDFPADREPDFRAAVATITGGAPVPPTPNNSTAAASPASAERISFIVHIVEPTNP